MPTVTIDVRCKYTTEEELAIIDALHRAMMEGIKTPEWDKNIRLVVHEPHRFTSPPGKSDRYTLVTFDMLSGRSIEAKRNLYSAIVKNLSELGIAPADVLINLREHPSENWASKAEGLRRKSISASRSTSSQAAEAPRRRVPA